MNVQRCNICQKQGGKPVSPLLPPLLYKYLQVKVHGKVLACDPCSGLIRLWDEFASEAKLNLENSFPCPKQVEIGALENGSTTTSVKKEMVHGSSRNSTDNSAVICNTPEITCIDILDDETDNQMKQTTSQPTSATHVNKKSEEIDVIYVKADSLKTHTLQDSCHKQSRPHCAASLPHAVEKNAQTSNTAPQRWERSQASKHEKHEISASKVMPEFQCSLCNKKFLYLHSFRLHNKAAHKRQTVKEGFKKCPSCNIDISNKKFFSHFIIHHSQPKNNLYCCILCSKKFTQRTSIISHFKQHCRYSCNVCGKKMSSQLDLQEHEKLLHRNKISTCDEQSVLQNQSHIGHLKKLNENDYKDVTSHERSTTTGLSEAHASNENNFLEKYYTCYVCSKHFCNKSKKKLRMHMWHHFNSHPKQNKFKHSLIKFTKFECKCCTENFSSRKNLLVHVRHQHLEAVTTNKSQPLYFPCSSCEKIYSSYAALYFHMNKFHSAILDKIKKENLERQMKKSGYNLLKLRCYICKKAYSTKLGLRIHISKMHPKSKKVTQNNHKQFKCDLCNSKFIRERTLQTHLTKMHKVNLELNTKTKKYECNICLRLFASELSIQCHVRNFHPKNK